jgi:hypothetical protein
MAGGVYEEEWQDDWGPDPGGRPTGTEWFNAHEFACRVCGLRLDTAAEVRAAGMEPYWKVRDLDPGDFRPFDEDAYEKWRAEQIRLGEWPPAEW